MNRLPWAPLNAGVFLIIFGGVILVSFFNIGVLNLGTAFPLIFTFFGAWLVIEAFVIPPANAYAPPRTMVVGWGALIGGLGVLWFVGATNVELLPIALALLVVIAGIGAVGYSFMRATPSTPKTSTS
jgi:Na+/melibiose symporter-like transporter